MDNDALASVGSSNKRSLDAAESMDRVEPIEVGTNISVFMKEVKTRWFNTSEDKIETRASETTD